MKRNIKKSLALLLAIIMLSAYPSFSGAFSAEQTEISVTENNTEFAKETAEIIKNDDSMLRIIGKFSKLPSEDEFALARKSVISESGRFVLQFSSENDLVACLDKLSKSPDIIYVERDRPVYTEALEASAEYLSWGVEAIEADVYSQSVTLPSDGRSVTVAIVDSGCEDIDFIKNKLVTGYDFTDNDYDATQDESTDSHGTFLASIVADCTRNIPVSIMPVRVLNSKTGSLINIVNGILYAVDNGANVINISIGAVMKNCSSLEDAVNYAETNNVNVVVCAGNNKIDIKNFCPAHIENAITVSSVNSENKFSESFSNYGNKIDLAAPGENIIGYNAAGEKTVSNGTSMSAAFVSAAAAMFRLQNPNCNTRQVRDALISCAEDCGDEGWDAYYGWGVLKLATLLNSDKKYVESVSIAQDSYELFVGETLRIEPEFSPADATDKTFILNVFGNSVSVNGNVISAVTAGISAVTVTSNDGEYTDSVQITVKEKPPEITAILIIQNNPGIKTVNFGETLRLTAQITDRPENTAVWWYVDGNKTGEGETFEISPSSGRVSITAKLVDADGNAVVNSRGFEISDSETVTVNSGFFQKIISFLKNLFRLNRTVVQKIF